MSTGNLLTTSLSASSSYHRALRRMWLASSLSIILLEKKSWISCIHRCDRVWVNTEKFSSLLCTETTGYRAPGCFYSLYFTLLSLTLSLVKGGSAVNPNSYPHELQWGQGTQCFHRMTAIYSNSQYQLYYFGIVICARPTPSSRGQPSWFSPTETGYIPQALRGSRDGPWPLAEFSIAPSSWLRGLPVSL